eukprot:scaffold1459_cov260-Pinguiococcus_pyrenoidosus.AAC.24
MVHEQALTRVCARHSGPPDPSDTAGARCCFVPRCRPGAHDVAEIGRAVSPGMRVDIVGAPAKNLDAEDHDAIVRGAQANTRAASFCDLKARATTCRRRQIRNGFAAGCTQRGDTGIHDLRRLELDHRVREAVVHREVAQGGSHEDLVAFTTTPTDHRHRTHGCQRFVSIDHVPLELELEEAGPVRVS